MENLALKKGQNVKITFIRDDYSDRYHAAVAFRESMDALKKAEENRCHCDACTVARTSIQTRSFSRSSGNIGLGLATGLAMGMVIGH